MPTLSQGASIVMEIRKTSTLFGHEFEKIRTLAWYNPWGALMLHGKIETRIVSAGRKPPFPLGKYLMYTTKVPMHRDQVLEACSDLGFIEGLAMVNTIYAKIANEPVAQLDGYAFAVGELAEIRKMTVADVPQCFVPFSENRVCLVFENIERIDPFKWNFGKQGVGILPQEVYAKIKVSNR